MDKYKQLLEQITEIMLSKDECALESAIKCFDPALTSIPLRNNDTQNRLLLDLEKIAQSHIEQNSFYGASEFSTLINSERDIRRMPSRIISSRLGEFCKDDWVSDDKDFITILRKVQISALECEKSMVKQLSELLKGENENTYLGLTTKKNQTLLEGDIRKIQYQIRLDELAKERQELIEKRKSGEIDAITYSKQSRINQALTEKVDLIMEQIDKSTLYKVCTLEIRANKIIGYNSFEDLLIQTQEAQEAQDEYKRLTIEADLKDDEIAHLEGNISEAEYNEAEEIARKKLETLERQIESRQNSNVETTSGKSI